MGHSCKSALRRITYMYDTFQEKSLLVQVMSALSQMWPRSVSSYGAIGPKWVKNELVHAPGVHCWKREDKPCFRPKSLDVRQRNHQKEQGFWTEFTRDFSKQIPRISGPRYLQIVIEIVIDQDQWSPLGPTGPHESYPWIMVYKISQRLN